MGRLGSAGAGAQPASLPGRGFPTASPGGPGIAWGPLGSFRPAASRLRPTHHRHHHHHHDHHEYHHHRHKGTGPSKNRPDSPVRAWLSSQELGPGCGPGAYGTATWDYPPRRRVPDGFPPPRRGCIGASPASQVVSGRPRHPGQTFVPPRRCNGTWGEGIGAAGLCRSWSATCQPSWPWFPAASPRWQGIAGGLSALSVRCFAAPPKSPPASPPSLHPKGEFQYCIRDMFTIVPERFCKFS